MGGGEGNVVQTPAGGGGGGDISCIGITVVVVVVSSPTNTRTSRSILVRDTLYVHLDAVLIHPECVSVFDKKQN